MAEIIYETIKDSDAVECFIKQSDLVRCKDCKCGEKSPTFQYYPNVTWCNKYLTSHNDNWYCADGKRKTNCSDNPNS